MDELLQTLGKDLGSIGTAFIALRVLFQMYNKANESHIEALRSQISFLESIVENKGGGSQ